MLTTHNLIYILKHNYNNCLYYYHNDYYLLFIIININRDLGREKIALRRLFLFIYLLLLLLLLFEQGLGVEKDSSSERKTWQVYCFGKKDMS